MQNFSQKVHDEIRDLLASLRMALAGRVGPSSRTMPSQPRRAASVPTRTATPPAAPHAKGAATTLPDLPSLRVGIDEDAALRKKLAQVVDLDLTDAPLDAALEKLSEAANVNIVLNRNSLAEVGIEPNEPITFRGKGRRFGDALRTTLDPLGLTWSVGEHVVHVGRGEVVGGVRIVEHFYDLRRIKAVLRRHMQGPLAPQPVLVRPRFAGIGGAVPPDFDLSMPMRFADRMPVPDDRIVALLIDHTRASWLVPDISGGTATPYGDLLAVRQTEWAHEQIDVLLAGLQEALEGKLDHGSLPLWPPSPLDRAANAAVRAALDEKIDVEFRETPLNRALASIGVRLGVRVRLDESQLQQEGILVDAPVTARLIGLPARVVLRNLLEPLALASIVKDGELFVTSEYKTSAYRMSTIYDVRDLADRLRGDELLDLLFDGTSGVWHEYDGAGDGFADMPVPGILVVRQSQPVHDEVGRLLANLRVALAGHPPRKRTAPRSSEEMSWKTYVLPEPATGQRGQPDIHDFERRVRREVDPESWYHYGGQARTYVVSDFKRYDVSVLQTAAAHAKIDRLLKWLTGSTPKRTESDEKK